MPKKKLRYPERPWTPDRAKWAKLLDKPDSSKMRSEIKPKGGWQLWDWRTLEDKPQE